MQLEAAGGTVFDRMLLQLMTTHHGGAIGMAEPSKPTCQPADRRPGQGDRHISDRRTHGDEHDPAEPLNPRGEGALVHPPPPAPAPEGGPHVAVGSVPWSEIGNRALGSRNAGS